VVADVGIPFDDTANSPLDDDTANSPLGRILGPNVMLIPDDTPVGDSADPRGPDKFSGFDSKDGNMFMGGPCEGFSVIENGVNRTGLTAILNILTQWRGWYCLVDTDEYL
jgi:hypothetical protein